MKIKIKWVFMLLLCLDASIPALFSQVLYVKQDAHGTGDGTSWENAIPDLQVAIDSADTNEQIWIAAGTYHPGGGSPTLASVFSIKTSISLFGGFNGTEQSLDERDINLNLTILSGDILENDVEGDFAVNKADNTLHVIVVDSLADHVTLDGLRITGGNTQNVNNVPEYQRAGGGIYSAGPVSIRNCYFYGNFGRSGGGLYLAHRASLSRIHNAFFSFNKSTERGAGIAGISIYDIRVDSCMADHNETARGSFHFMLCNGIAISDCQFADNVNFVINTASAGIGSINNRNLVVRDCRFLRNRATGGTGIIVVGDGIPEGEKSFIRVEGCRFEQNAASNGGWGGGIFCRFNPDITISACDFSNNTAGSGGGITIDQSQASWKDTANVLVEHCRFYGNISDDFGGGALRMHYTASQVRHCMFEGNMADKGGHVFLLCSQSKNYFVLDTFYNGTSTSWGGALEASGNLAEYFFDSCRFQFNTCQDQGGVAHHGLGATCLYRHCHFESNQAERGGVIFLNSDTTNILIANSECRFNIATFLGGVVFCGFGNGKVKLVRSRMSNNQAGDDGGVIYMNESGDDGQAEIELTDCIMDFNFSGNSGAVLLGENVTTTITSSLLYNNYVNHNLGAGILEFVAIDSVGSETTLLNTTIADSEGFLPRGIVLRDDQNPGRAKLKLQNTILNTQSGQNLYVKVVYPELISLGGNMSDDTSMVGMLSEPKDLNEIQPQYTDPAFPVYDFSLQADSPGVDDGVAGAPDFDILGNPRVNEPDMGAYEYQMPSHVWTPSGTQSSVVGLIPNPARHQDELTGIINNDWRGIVQVFIADLKGQVVWANVVRKTEDINRFPIVLQGITPGAYSITFVRGNQVLTNQFMVVD